MLFILRYYLWVNTAGFALAAFDKFVAMSFSVTPFQRISESTLLVMAAIGAFPGESVAFACFNHKTRKREWGAVPCDDAVVPLLTRIPLPILRLMWSESFRHAFVFATACHLLLFLLTWQLGFMRFFF